jgi:hypothetical protein
MSNKLFILRRGAAHGPTNAMALPVTERGDDPLMHTIGDAR